MKPPKIKNAQDAGTDGRNGSRQPLQPRRAICMGQGGGVRGETGQICGAKGTRLSRGKKKIPVEKETKATKRINLKTKSGRSEGI